MVNLQDTALQLNSHSKDITCTRAGVSVIIPCYRCGETIDRALASIAAQTIMPKEVILVEDSSPDDGVTLKTLRDQAAKYADDFDVKLIALDQNQGVANARNTGWAIAQQPYIAFLDADDSWHPEKLCIQYKYMLSHPDVALCSHQSLLLRKAEVLPVVPATVYETEISAGDLLFKNALVTSTVMIKRNIPYRFLEKKRYAEDFLLWQQVAWAGLRVVRIESPLSYMYKPAYGAAGLSAQLWNMEKGELDNFVFLYHKGYINLLLCLASVIFSMAKFFKRLLVNKAQRLAVIIRMTKKIS